MGWRGLILPPIGIQALQSRGTVDPKEALRKRDEKVGSEITAHTYERARFVGARAEEKGPKFLRFTHVHTIPLSGVSLTRIERSWPRFPGHFLCMPTVMNPAESIRDQPRLVTWS